MTSGRRKLQRTAKDAVVASKIEKELHASSTKKKQLKQTKFSQNDSSLSTPKKRVMKSSQRSDKSTPVKANKKFQSPKRTPVVTISNRKKKVQSTASLSPPSSPYSTNEDDILQIDNIDTNKAKSSIDTNGKQQWQCTVCTIWNNCNKRKCTMCRSARRNNSSCNILSNKLRTIRSTQEEEFFTPQEETADVETELSPDLLNKDEFKEKKRNINHRLASISTKQSKKDEIPVSKSINYLSIDSDSDSSLLNEQPFAKKRKTPTKDPKAKSEEKDPISPKQSPENTQKQSETQNTSSYNPFILNTPSTVSTNTAPILSQQHKKIQDTTSQNDEQKKVVSTFASPTQVNEPMGDCTSSSTTSASSIPVDNANKDEDKITPKALIFTPGTNEKIEKSKTIIKPTPENTADFTTPTITYQLPVASDTTPSNERQQNFIQDITNMISNYNKESQEEKDKLQQLIHLQKCQIASLSMKLEDEMTKRLELELSISSWWKEKTCACSSTSPPNWMKDIVTTKPVATPEQRTEEYSEDNTNSQIRSIVASVGAQFNDKPSHKSSPVKKTYSTTLKGWNQKVKEGMANFTDIGTTTKKEPSDPTPSKKVIVNPYTKKQQPYKYQQVIRKKDIRRGLPGHDCEHCRDFINAICCDENDKTKFLNTCSKHKAEFSPDHTPDGFWELSFADSLRNRG